MSRRVTVQKLSSGIVGIPNSESNTNPIFARHETFHPRFGWIKKGFDRTVQDPEIFSREDAPVGVGKNMARSIRYWCSAFKVLEDKYPSEFGLRLLGNNGWDQFLEDPASLWLLHWQLLKSPCYATAWYFIFNIFRQIEFSVEDVFYTLCDYRDRNDIRVVDSSLRKDISCILRMYVEQSSKSGPNEDSLDCPFTELGILHAVGDSKYYMFRVGSKKNLPPEIIVAACLDFAVQEGRGQKTISVSRLLFEMGSPGMAFKLSESAICEAIEEVARWSDHISLSDTAGLIQLSFTQEPSILTGNILNRYYQNRGEAL
jgi:Protein of unknown function (DUF4007)